MNKGLEVIEAHYLYGTDYDNIDIVIHPQSIIHSMVETADSSVLAQLGWPDMRLPILYTMTWPERLEASEETWPRLDFIKMGDLTFKEPDHAKYPSMQVAYAAGRAGGTMTGALLPTHSHTHACATCSCCAHRIASCGLSRCGFRGFGDVAEGYLLLVPVAVPVQACFRPRTRRQWNSSWRRRLAT